MLIVLMVIMNAIFSVMYLLSPSHGHVHLLLTSAAPHSAFDASTNKA
jgi:hypothetical protein